VADLPAGLDAYDLATATPTSARRGRVRRRVAFLRAARELLLRDLGGFVYELHRTAHDIEAEAHRRLRDTKLERLSRIDAELHVLEMRLDDVRRQVLVREPGVGGECPNCGELFGSAAHYCSDCGLPLTGSARRELARAQAPEPAPDPVIAPVPEGRPESPAATAAEQPTQELSLLDPDHPSTGSEFQWPRRDSQEPGSSWATAPTGLVGSEPSPEAAAPAEAVPAEPGEEAGPTEIPVDEPDAAVDHVTAASSEEAGSVEPAAEDPADATAPAAGDAAGPPDDAAPAASEDAGAPDDVAEEPADATDGADTSGSDADDGAPVGDPPRDQAAGPGESGGVNGVNPARDDDTFVHPVERRP
jgi:hypothetical protein